MGGDDPLPNDLSGRKSPDSDWRTTTADRNGAANSRSARTLIVGRARPAADISIAIIARQD
jgi:hypothetical protein